MNIVTVQRTTIELAGKEVDAYTAGEISSLTGLPINYLSGNGLAESIGLDHTTTVQKRLPKELKTMLGEGFTTVQGKYKNSTNAYSKVNLWDTVSAAKYYRYHDRQGNVTAGLIIDALASTTLDIIINDKLGVDYQKGQAERIAKARLLGKATRRELTDAIKDWYDRNPGGTRCPMFAMIARTTDAIYQAIWGVTALELEEFLGCERHKSRDFLCEADLRRLDRVEWTVMDCIDDDNVKPIDAVASVKIRERQLCTKKA